MNLNQVHSFALWLCFGEHHAKGIKEEKLVWVASALQFFGIPYLYDHSD